MKRRSFLKLAGLTATATLLHQRHALPSVTVDGKTTEPWPHKESGFCEFCEYGNSMSYTGSWQENGKFISRILHKHAKQVLPPGTYYEIRLRIPSWTAFDERGQRIDLTSCGAAWYYAPYMTRRLGTLAEPQLDMSGGYIFVGGYLA